MTYIIELSPEAEEHLKRHEKSGNKPLREKISRLLDELSEHPRSGTGRPEQVKHARQESWSRRINGKHRITYTINDETSTVAIHSMHGHYNDK
jgi:toxin YoeB